MPDQTSPSILLVEDNGSDARATIRAISRTRPELTVQWASDVPAANSLLNDLSSQGLATPGCIVLDLNLPGSSGLEFLRELRAHTETATLPVLILTTSQHRSDREAAAVFGANGFATKAPGIRGLDETGSIISRFWDRHVLQVAMRDQSSSELDAPLENDQVLLIVEDDDGFARSLERLLDRVLPEYQRVRARSLAEALVALDMSRPAVVLTDLGLPDSTAIETVNRLVDKAPTTPVVVLTGRSFDELGPAAVDAGAHDFLTKGSIDTASLARILRVAMRRSAVHFREVHAAHHDSLTGLVNRSHFESSLLVRCGRAKRGEQFGLVFIDVNDFKEVNDRFGHGVGDTVLIAVANRLKQVVRCDDIAARWGGDEFAVLLGTVTTGYDAEAAASRIISAIDGPLELTMPSTGEAFSYDISVCLGAILSGLGESALDAKAIMNAADRAMYQSKANDRPYVIA